ncbi:MAG TPA: ADOP family duplicated permease, partial [Bryobacteraceae bacterium]|nr:ADOP family duplicated permease [Bryobacteraceae bacterium]
MHLFFDSLAQDIRFALRTYRRSPGFTATALIAIALGVGATAAVFSVVDRILFRSLPYRAETQLVSFGMLAKVVDDGEFLFAADFKDVTEANSPFRSIAHWSGVNDCDLTGGNPVRERCAEVGANFLAVLGVRPILGDGFTFADVQPGAPRKVMLSYGVWKGRFGADPQIAGKSLMLDGAPARIAGVLPASFELPTLQQAELLTPDIVLPAGWQHNATRVLRVIGRLKDGVTIEGARAQLAGRFARMLSYVPPPFRKEVQFRVRSLRDRQMGSAAVASWTLFGAALAVLLIAAANVANLLLARSASRQAELAVRAALGISRARLIRQMLTESLLLALAGCVTGCALAAIILRVLVRAAPHSLPHLENASLDGRVLVVSLLLSLATGLVFGLAPAVQQPRAETLGSARSVSPRSSTFFKNALVAAQIAVSMVLVAAAGLLVRSLWNLETQSLGMQPEHVLTAQLVLPASRYKTPEERIAFFNLIEQQLGSIPGMRALGLSDSLPPGGWERSRPLSALAVRGQPKRTDGTGGLITWRYVSPGYFDVLRIPLLEGRAFREDERDRKVTPYIVSQSLARRLFGAQNAVGQHLQSGAEIVGVAPDVKNSGLAGASNPEYYVLRAHIPDDVYVNGTGAVAQRTLSLLFRSAISADTLRGLVRQKIAAIDGTLPLQFQTMRSRLSELAEGPRFDALLLISFAAAGLLLAAIGLYGTIAYLVTQCTQEIGIRMSLGATPAGIARMMLAHSIKWTAAGAAVGVIAS